jgi:hypothetical protein
LSLLYYRPLNKSLKQTPRLGQKQMMGKGGAAHLEAVSHPQIHT